MADKKKEQAMVVSQEQIADGIFSMWIHTEAAQSARPGQFISMYTKDATKLLPRPISICEINKEDSRLRVVYRVTGENTGTEEFSKLKTGDAIPIIGPLGNGFPFEAAEGKKVFLMGGGIGVPPILELAKQMKCDKKQIVVGYRDAQTFLKEEFEQNGELYISTENGSVGTTGNVMDAIRENGLEADMIYACGPTPMLRAIKQPRNIRLYAIYLWKSVWHVELVPVLAVCARQKRKMPTAMCATSESVKMVRYSLLRRWKSNEYECKHRRSRMEEPGYSSIWNIWFRRRIF